MYRDRGKYRDKRIIEENENTRNRHFQLRARSMVNYFYTIYVCMKLFNRLLSFSFLFFPFFFSPHFFFFFISIESRYCLYVFYSKYILMIIPTS